MTELSDKVQYLKEQLGEKVFSYLSGLDDGSQLQSTSDVNNRLCYAYDAVKSIVDVYDNKTAIAWLFGANTNLRNEAPAYLLRHSDNSNEELSLVVSLAKEFSQ